MTLYLSPSPRRRGRQPVNPNPASQPRQSDPRSSREQRTLLKKESSTRNTLGSTCPLQIPVLNRHLPCTDRARRAAIILLLRLHTNKIPPWPLAPRKMAVSRREIWRAIFRSCPEHGPGPAPRQLSFFSSWLALVAPTKATCPPCSAEGTAVLLPWTSWRASTSLGIERSRRRQSEAREGKRSSKMTSSADQPGPMPAGPDEVPGKPKTITTSVLDAAAHTLQTLAPIKQFQQHVCTWAIFSHDMRRQIETHHYCARLNEDFVQCAVYDSDQSDARLIGVEYVISDKLFDGLPDEEKKLWHSHAYEIKAGLWVNPGVPEMIQQQELKKLVNTYGKFWCTWQFDRGDRLPLGVPALMMSPQPESWGQIPAEQVKKRDEKYGIKSKEISESRVSLAAPEHIHPLADYWRRTGKGWAVELKEVDMALPAGSPLSHLRPGKEQGGSQAHL